MKNDELVYLLEWQMPRPTEEVQWQPEGICDWAEASVWTPRMLESLRKGSEVGRLWHSLIDKVWKMDNLRSAFGRVKANRGAAGVDHISVMKYERDLERNLERLGEELRSGRYRPDPIRRVWIDKPGSKGRKRPLGIPTVKDRIAQCALRNVIEPIFEYGFAEDSYGFRPRRSAKDALRRVGGMLKEGKLFVLDADIEGFFDEIPHDLLMAKLGGTLSDSRVLKLVESYLKCKTVDGQQRSTSAKGTPQGSVISPLLANLYLNDLDHLMQREGFCKVRYADDFIILGDDPKRARQARVLVEGWCELHGLRLHPDKTKLVEVTKKVGFDFLGYHFRSHRHWMSRKSLVKTRSNLQPWLRRTQRGSVEDVSERINPILRGVYGYFKHAAHSDMRGIDQWVRMRLRSIKRKQRKRKGRGRGLDHFLYPNAYFAELGLFSLEESQRLKC